MTMLNPLAFLLLPLAALVFLWVRQGVNRYLKSNPSAKGLRHILRPWVSGLAVFLLVLALARPVWNPEPRKMLRSGQDTVFLVDVSRSMETRDLGETTRIEAVRAAILDLAVTGLDGDRVALVAFAGTSVVKCPLTPDIAYFRQAVSLLDTSATSRGGTLLGDALRNTAKLFGRPGHEVSLWVFTDGGDQESFPVEAARALGEAGFRLHVWGVGTTEGGQVPDREVRSGLNQELLQAMVQAVPDATWTGPEIPVWNLPDLYSRYHHQDSSREISGFTWEEGAWWLVWPILVLVLLDLLLRFDYGMISVVRRKK